MGKSRDFQRGFTLMELLVALGIIALLAALLLPVVIKAKGKAKRATCLNNLRQINLAVRMYADDFRDKVVAPPGAYTTIEAWYRYKEIVKTYAGQSGGQSRPAKLFSCPADAFFYSASGYHSQGLCEMARTGYSSYIFNAGNLVGSNSYPGIFGKSLAAVREPSRTVLVCEAAAFTPFCWHEPNRQDTDYRFKDCRNMMSFVDGHAQYLRVYWSGAGEAWQYDPPADYDYRWSGQ